MSYYENLGGSIYFVILGVAKGNTYHDMRPLQHPEIPVEISAETSTGFSDKKVPSATGILSGIIFCFWTLYSQIPLCLHFCGC